MPRKNGNTFPADEEAARLLSDGLSRFLRDILAHTAYTQTTFAQAIGFSRVTLNQVLQSKNGRYLWRLPMICAAARALGLTVPDMVHAADALSRGDVGPYMECVKRVGNASISPSGNRLQDLIVRTLNSYCDFFPGGKSGMAPKDRPDFEAAYRCSVVEIEQGAPSFYEAVMSRKLTDGEIAGVLWSAAQYAGDHGGLENVPFWVAVKRVFEAR